MERRQFIHLTVAGAVGMGLSGAVWLPAAEPPMTILAHPELLTLLDGGERVTEIGEAYRAAFRREQTADALASAILSDAELSTNLPETALREGLAQQIRHDFAERRTVRVNGWILSRTEARQCALYSILPSSLP